MDTTKKLKTNVYNLIILDESGSMGCIKRLALNGLNETLQTIRMVQKDFPDQKQFVSILSFDTTHMNFLRKKESITEVQDLEQKEYNPYGGTPLFDAIGIGVNSLINDVTPNDSVLVTIITDGEENSSKEYTGRAIATLISSLKNQGWLFTYIGANQDAVQVASTMNINNAMNFEQDEEGTRAMFEKEHRARYRCMSLRNELASLPADEALHAIHSMPESYDYFEDEKD